MSDPIPSGSTFFIAEEDDINKEGKQEEAKQAVQAAPFLDEVMAWFDEQIQACDSNRLTIDVRERYEVSTDEAITALDIVRQTLEEKKAELSNLKINLGQVFHVGLHFSSVQSYEAHLTSNVSANAKAVKLIKGEYMAEEANDVVQDVAPVTDAVVDTVETTTDPSSEVEQTAEETQADTEVEAEESTEETAEAETDSVEENTEELKPKSQNRFQRLANENRELKDHVKQLEALKVPTEEDYIDSGMDATEAKLSALEANLQQRDAVESIVNLNQSVESDLEQTMREYPQLDPQSKQFNEKLASSVMAQYDRDSGAEYDQSGIMIRTSQLPYEYIKDKMNLVGMASAQAKVEAQKNVESMVAHADTPSSTAPTQDPKTETTEQMRERLAGIKF